MFLTKYPKLLAGISWALNFLVIFYFAYLSWGASIDFNGFTSMIFGIPVLVVLLIGAYLAGMHSEKKSRTSRFSKCSSQIMTIALGLFYISGLFPSLQKISDIPIKVTTKLSKALTGKTPDDWVRQ